METIADIVAEMRAKTAKSKDEAWYDKEKWAELCNRIEAALEFELAVEKSKAAGEGYAAGKQSVTECNQHSNAAKIREALEAINRIDTRGLKRILYAFIDWLFAEAKGEAK